MDKKFINARKKYILNVDKIYKNDFNLLKTIAQTKKMRHNNKALENRKKKLKELMIEINNEYLSHNNPSRKSLRESNENFHNEYELFNKRTNKKDTKVVFKDLVKLYKSKGYRIPNFSINTHNLFKINPLLEANTDMISNGLLESQMSKKTDDSEKTVRYLKKLGIILSDRMSTDRNLQKDLMKKLNLPKFKIVVNEEDSIENLKKKIEILTNLINTNALSKLDEHKKRKNKNIYRQSSYASYNYKSNKRLNINKEKNSASRRTSNCNKRVSKIGTGKEANYNPERRNSNDSIISNTSYISNANFFNRKINNNEKSSDSINRIFNFTNNPGLNFPKTPKNIGIPIINFHRINQKKDTNYSAVSNIERIDKNVLNLESNLSSKQNNALKIKRIYSSKNNNIINFKSQTNNNKYKLKTLGPIPKNKKNQLPFYIKNQSNNDSNNSNFSDEFFYDSKSPREGNKNNNSRKDRKKNESFNSYPYTSRNEFINFAFNRFSRRNVEDAEKYIKNYLNKIKGYDNEQIEIFVNDIYDKNVKNNIKELEKQITDKDLYSKTERLYLNNHLIKRIKPLLNTMGERDKIIQRLEKNLTDAVVNK